MIRFLSPEWIAALDAAGRQARLPDGARLILQQVVEMDGGAELAYHVVVADGAVRVSAGRADRPDVTMTQPYGVAAAISRGEQNAQAAIVAGSLRLAGDLELLMGLARGLAGLEDVFAGVRDETEY